MYDVICIGAGLNYSLAIVLAKKGKKVALIEKDFNHMGGTCLHNGCIPTKNLLHRAKVVLESKEDIFKTSGEIDFKELQKKIFSKVALQNGAIKKQCEMAGVELIEGEGFVVDDGVEINGKVLKGEKIVIGSGSFPYIPKDIEYDKKHIITSNEALQLEMIPNEIYIYGSGVIGIEMASLFAVLGSKVFLVYRHNHISNRYSIEMVERLEKQLKNIGVTLIPNSTIKNGVTKNNKVVMQIDDKKIETEYLLVATGRVPNTSCIKTNKIKIEKGIQTDNFFRTTMKNVFAIGDVNGKQLLAHSARAQALNVAKQILDEKVESLNLDNIPKFIYSLPLSYGSIGKQGDKKSVFSLNKLGISGSSYLDDDGLVIVYADKENFLTGAEIFSPNGEELISIFSVALAGELDKDTFLKAVFPHPTYSESFDRVVRGI
jgi:dihydrolipoamide dehydrogenase